MFRIIFNDSETSNWTWEDAAPLKATVHFSLIFL